MAYHVTVSYPNELVRKGERFCKRAADFGGIADGEPKPSHESADMTAENYRFDAPSGAVSFACNYRMVLLGGNGRTTGGFKIEINPTPSPFFEAHVGDGALPIDR